MAAKLVSALFPKHSLLGKLNVYVSTLVMLLVTLALIVFSIVTYRFQMEERADNVRAIGSTLARLVARPVSVGDYVLVESYLNPEGLPAFIDSLVLVAASGEQVAKYQNNLNDDSTCKFKTSTEVMVPTGDPLAISREGTLTPRLLIVANNCDLKKSILNLSVLVLAIGIILFLFVSIAARFSISLALRPLYQSVGLRLTRDSLGDDVIEKAPLEVRPLIKQIKDLFDQLLEAESKSKVAELAAQVAHDIRSPSAVIDSVTKDLTDVSKDKYKILSGAVQRINDIANGLIALDRESNLAHRPPAIQNKTAVLEHNTHCIRELIEPLVSEKRIQFKSRMHVTLEFVPQGEARGIFAKIDPIEFPRTISNIIDNAFEAVGPEGKVRIELEVDSNECRISISDDGKGIPREILPTLMQKGVTFGKANGSGLGLFHAKKSIESWKGSISIISKEKRGTTVQIRIPQAKPPSWYVDKLSIVNDGAVAIIDDDLNIHGLWQSKLSSVVDCRKNFKTFYFSDPDTFTRWWIERKLEDHYLILCDFEFAGTETNGIELIHRLGIEEQSVLVTSRSFEPAILADCEKLGISLLPKPDIGTISVSVISKDISPDLILIDDDILMHQTWSLRAKELGMRLEVFKSGEEFLRYPSGVFSLETPIYVDQNLNSRLDGLMVSSMLNSRGYQKIYLATGATIDTPKPAYIQEIIGKEFPINR